MFCGKCGNKCVENAAFCPKCGNAFSSVKSNQAQSNISVAEMVNTSKQNQKNKKVGIVFISLLLVVVSVFLIFLLNGIFSNRTDETFVCSYCGGTFDGKYKHEQVDSYGDVWDVCDDCYQELVDMGSYWR